jgi:ABC-type arginine/histidine transport system permease subunit
MSGFLILQSCRCSFSFLLSVLFSPCTAVINADLCMILTHLFFISWFLITLFHGTAIVICCWIFYVASSPFLKMNYSDTFWDLLTDAKLSCFRS